MLHSNWPWRRAAWNQAAYDRSGRGSHTSAGYRMSVQPQDLLGFTTFYGCLRLFKSPSFFIDSHMLKIDKRELKIAWLVRATRDWNRKPLAKIFLEMTSGSLIFCHSLCGSFFVFFPSPPSSIICACESPFPLSIAKLSVVTTNLISFQVLLCKTKEKALPTLNKHTKRSRLLKSETLRVVVFVSPQLQFSLP